MKVPLCADGRMRLVDGPSRYEGRVEICNNRQWGTICDNFSNYPSSSIWSNLTAKVVCRQLGFIEAGNSTVIALRCHLLHSNVTLI